ncbi:MAG TPA: glucokinase, partial [Sphingobacteriaceae bacterium]
ISDNADQALICGETMNIFIRYLATEAANLALKLKATGGVFIGGGIIPKILKLIQPDLFMESFLDFGRMKPLLQSMPVKIILNEDTALLGAAWYGAH